MTIQIKIPGFIIREALPEDLSLILSFIKDLAEYEKLLHEVLPLKRPFKNLSSVSARLRR